MAQIADNEQKLREIMARYHARECFNIARRQNLDLTIVAEEAVIQSMAVLAGRSVESARAQLGQALVNAVNGAKALLDAEPAGAA